MKYICSEATAVCSVSQVLMCCIFVIPCIKLEDVSSADVTEGHYYCYIVCVCVSALSNISDIRHLET